MKKSFILTMVLLLCAIFVLVSVTYSWFNFAKKNEVDYFDIDVIQVDELKLSINKVDYGFDVETSKGVQLEPVTGFGEKMFTPVMGLTEVYESDEYSAYQYLPVSYTEITNLEKNKAIYSSYIYVDSTTNGNLGIKLDSLSVDVVEKTEDSGISQFGLDMNYIKSALRVAILQNIDGVYKTKFLWIPFPNYELTLKNGVYSINQNGKKESEYIFVTGLEKQNCFKVETKNKDRYYDKNRDITFYFGDSENSDEIINFGKIENNVSDLLIVMWLDGWDRECQPAFQAAVEGFFNCNVSLKITFTTNG